MTAFLQIEEARRRFGGVLALDSVSLELAAGELTALIGPNGAGKTTLFNLVAGALAPTAGRVLFQGRPVTGAAAACRQGIARTFQNVRLFGGMTVLENVLVGMGGHGFWAGALPWPAGHRAETRRRRAAYFLLERFGLDAYAERQAAGLPFGVQRVAEIARALAAGPKLLLLDEPAAGLNRTETRQLELLLRQIHREGVTLLLVEHDMPLVMSLARRVVVLDCGRIIADGTPDVVRHDSRVRAAYLGGDAHG
jgi:ABC-type branched-subunit amino acid transport system ATPase component